MRNGTSDTQIANDLKRADYYIQVGKLEKAEEVYQKMLALYPGHSDVLHLLGLIAYQKSNFDKSIELIQEAICNSPNDPVYHRSLGDTLKDRGLIDDAIFSYQKALKLKPNYVDALNNLGNAYHIQGNYNEAIICYQRAIKFKPKYPKAYNNMGKTFQDQGYLGKALLCYEKALGLEYNYAEARFNRSVALLLTGNLLEGWNEYEWRFKQNDAENIYPYHFDRPYWDGRSFKGKMILVYSEQGYGDTIQFVRYLPQVKALGGTVIFETFPPLIGMFKSFSGFDVLSEFSFDRKTNIDFDYHIPLLSLPRIFKTNLDTIPSSTPYLLAEAQKREYWKTQISVSGLRIGIAWAGKPSYGNDKIRSIGLSRFIKLSQIPNLTLYGLQKETTLAADKCKDNTVINLGDNFEDFTDTAGVIDNLDLVISVDTAVAHLAGAMGKPVWVLLPLVPDWRWLLERQDSPWYPTMRLFRQETIGDWDRVFERVASELNALAQSTLKPVKK